MKYFLSTISFLLVIFFCKAQVAVSKEPRHHNVFTNSYLRLLDVHIAPGDTTLFHVHQTPSVFISLSATKTGSEVRSEDDRDKKLIGSGILSFTGFYRQPRIHRVWNSDTTEFHVMDVELLNRNPKVTDAPIRQKGVQLLFDEQPARGYLLSMNVRTGYRIKQRKAPLLVVGLTNADTKVNRKRFQKVGDFLFIPPDQPIEFTNKKSPFVRFAVLELK